MKIRSVFSNSAGILLSRIFGFIRDLAMASILGANIYSDMFFVAFKLPNLFRRIFAEGAFAQSFMPSFIASTRKSIFSAKIALIFLALTTALSIAVSLLGPYVTMLVAPGFETQMLTVTARFVAIQFWYLPLVFGVTFLGSLLQYKEHFATTAFSTVLLNISLIVGLLLTRDEAGEDILLVLSWCVLAGGALQVAAHILMARKLGVTKMLCVGVVSLRKGGDRLKRDTKRFFKNFFPAIWGNSTAQIMAFLDTWLASFLATGSISYLYYANRIFQLPLALFAIALSIAIFPSIAKSIKNDKTDHAVMELKKGFWILLFLLSVAAIGGIVFSKEIIWLLFERGAFGREDTILSAETLRMYMIGLLPFGLAKLFSLWLYSRHEQLKAAKIATYTLAGYAASAVILIGPMGVKGLALASTISGFVNFTLLAAAFGSERLAMLFDHKKSMILLAVILVSTGVMLPIHEAVSGLIGL